MCAYDTSRDFRKRLDRLLLSFSNISRGFFISFFGLLVNYVLIHYKSSEVLQSYVYSMAAVNLSLVLSNWGGKEYNLKSFTDNPAQMQQTFNALLSSRVLLLIPVIAILLFFADPGQLTYLIALLLVFRTFNLVFESLVIIHRKIHTFFVIDFFLNLGFLLLIFFDDNNEDPRFFLWELCGMELVRVIMYLLFVVRPFTFSFSPGAGIRTLRRSFAFFLTALSGFVCSRADLYVVGIKLNRADMSNYYVLLNLVILAQVTYTTFVGTFSAGIYRASSKTFHRVLARAGTLGALLTLPAAITIFLMGRYYFELRLDLFYLLLISVNLLAFTFLLEQFYRFARAGKQHIFLRVTVFAGTINICLSWWLTDSLGQHGAFIGNTTGVVVTFLLLRFLPTTIAKTE